MHPDLDRLKEADAADRSLAASDRALRDARSRLQQATTAATHADAQRASASTALTALIQRERALQVELDGHRASQRAALRVLETGVGNPDAAERQRVGTLALIDETETRLLEVMEALDAARAHDTAAAAGASQAHQAQAQADAALGVAQAQAAADRPGWIAARDAALGAVDRELSARYLLLVQRKGTAVATIHQLACSACHVAVIQQDVTDLQRGLMAACRGCGRWLVV